MPDRSFHSLYQDFIEFEDDLNLMDQTIDGVYFWERVRFQIHRRLAEGLDRSGTASSESEGLEEYLLGIRLFLRNLVQKNPFLVTDKDYVFYGTGRRKRGEDGRWWDIYVDPVLEDVDASYEFLERPYQISHSRPTKTENLRYTDLVEYSGKICEKLGLWNVALSARERAFLDDIVDELDARFGVEIPLVELVERDLSQRRVRLPLFRRILDRISPDVAFLVMSYLGRETFVEACQRADIPVVELQHGVITKYHLGYSYPNRDKHVFPDHFFAFGEFWGDTIDLPIPRENVHAVGYPYLEREAEKYETTGSSEQVVFISQSVIGEELSRFAASLAEIEDHDRHIVYKLHPKEFDEWRDRYPWLRSADVEVVTDDPPLYRLLAESTAQIGVYSTALFEGLYFGVNTYVVDLPGHEYMKPLIESGYADLVVNPPDYVSGDGSATEAFNIEYFFEPEPVNKFTRFAEDIRGR